MTSRELGTITRTAKITVAEGVSLAADGTDVVSRSARPGATVAVPLGVRNDGANPITGVDLFFAINPWYGMAKHYSNCEYGHQRRLLPATLIFAILTAVRANRFSREEYLAAKQPPWLKILLIAATLFGALVLVFGLVVPLYFWIWVHPKLQQARQERTANEPSDQVWVQQAWQRYSEEVASLPGPPEVTAAAARDRLDADDPLAALLLLDEAVRRLHGSYVTRRMAERRPTIEDSYILINYLTALATVRKRRPNVRTAAAVASTAEHLAAITAACDATTHDATPYRFAIHRLRPGA